jgi:hypothetical protein
MQKTCCNSFARLNIHEFYGSSNQNSKNPVENVMQRNRMNGIHAFSDKNRMQSEIIPGILMVDRGRFQQTGLPIARQGIMWSL